MDPRILSWTKTVQEYQIRHPSLTGLPFHLLELEPRLRVFEFADEPQENIGENYAYIPRKDVILFPVALPAAEHEIAHMVEMSNINRIILPDWGIASHLNTKWDVKDIKMSSLIAAASREARVRAIQSHFSGFPHYPMWKHPVWGHDVEDRLKKEPFRRLKSFQDYKDWIDDLQMKTFNAWSPERIESEWIKRLNFIRDWMETK